MDNFHLRPGSLHAWHWSGYITIDSPPELEGPYGGAQGTTTQPATIVVSVPMDDHSLPYQRSPTLVQNKSLAWLLRKSW